MTPRLLLALFALAACGCGPTLVPLGPPDKLFSINYHTARAKFLESAEAAQARVTSYEHPKKALNGKPLFVDVAVIGSDKASSVLLVTSGVHGVETYAGSAVQTGLLRSGLLQKLRGNQTVVLVHALNPYGFDRFRSANHDNVDLDRNFVSHKEDDYPANDDYDQVAEACLLYTSDAADE